jgi:hypothetical protein
MKRPVAERTRLAKERLPKTRRPEPSPNRRAESTRPAMETAVESDIRRLNRLIEQLVTAVTELQEQVAELEARFCYQGRLSDELVTGPRRMQQLLEAWGKARKATR